VHTLFEETPRYLNSYCEATTQANCKEEARQRDPKTMVIATFFPGTTEIVPPTNERVDKAKKALEAESSQ
jgi:hypothetical protein